MQKFSKDNKIILHTHPADIIALTQNKVLKDEQKLNNILLGMQPETVVILPEGIGFVPYLLQGSQEIADATVEKCRTYRLIIWEKHGIFSIGKDIHDVFDSIDVVNKSASIYLKCKSAGFEPEGLDKSNWKV